MTKKFKTQKDLYSATRFYKVAGEFYLRTIISINGVSCKFQPEITNKNTLIPYMDFSKKGKSSLEYKKLDEPFIVIFK